MTAQVAAVCVGVAVLGCASSAPIAPDGGAQPDAAADVSDVATPSPAEAGVGDATVFDTIAEPEVPVDAPADAPVESPSPDAADDEVAVNPATWSNIYNRLLNNMSYVSNCTGEGCHNPGTQMNLDLSTQADGYTTVQAKLVPGNPEGSTIVYELETGMMPRGRPMMSPASLDLIKAWILAGAADD